MDSAEKNLLVTVTVALSFTLGIISILLVPVDVFILSEENKNPDAMMNRRDVGKLDLYINVLMLVFAFVWIPFVYFFGEEKEEKGDFDSDSKSKFTRIFAALKRTVFFVGLLTGLFVAGLIFRPSADHEGVEENNHAWAGNNSSSSQHAGEQAALFCLAILICLGMMLWVVNGAFGLSFIPVSLIKGKKSLLETKTELRSDLTRIRQQYQAIQEKYAGSHTKITKEDQKMLSYLKKKELSLAVKNVQLDIEQEAKGFIPKMMNILRPFERVIGFGCLVFSGLIFASIAITTFDRFLNSTCGFKCGFILEKENFLNPIDWLFVKSSNYFPLDYLFFFVFVFYFFICSFYGTIRFGIVILFQKRHEIRKDGTLPNSLLITGFLTSITILALSSQMMTLSPQYTSFGNQQYFSESHNAYKMCSFEKIAHHPDACQISNVSAFFNKISLSMPILGSLIFIGNFLFLIVFAYFFVSAWKTEKRSRYEKKEYELSEGEGERDRESVQLLI